MLTLLAAMKEELAGLKRHMVIEDSVAENGCRIFRGKKGGKEALLVLTGVGRERAESAARLVLERYPVIALVSFGFAGGLTPELGVGDIVLCSTLYSGDGQPDSYQSDAGLLSQSRQIWGSGVREGKSVTVAQLASRPEIKRALAQDFAADVVDMEGYWIARIARERRVPFLAVRAVSDTVGEELPPFEQIIGPDEERRWGKAVPYFLLHPLSLARIHRNFRRAGASLTAFLDRLMERL